MIGGANGSYTPTANKTLYAQYNSTPHSYDYSHATFNWSDFSCPNATVACGLDGGHSTNINTTVNSSESEPTYDTAGLRTYTAKFTENSVDYTDTKTESIPALQTLISLDDIKLDDASLSGVCSIAPSVHENDISYEIAGFSATGGHSRVCF